MHIQCFLSKSMKENHIQISLDIDNIILNSIYAWIHRELNQQIYLHLLNRIVTTKNLCTHVFITLLQYCESVMKIIKAWQRKVHFLDISINFLFFSWIQGLKIYQNDWYHVKLERLTKICWTMSANYDDI